MEKVTLETLKGYTDDQLLDVLGFKNKVENFKEQIKKADELKGDARKEVESEIERMFTPHVYPEDLKWKIESAERHAKMKRTGKDEACHCGCDILD